MHQRFHSSNWLWARTRHGSKHRSRPHVTTIVKLFLAEAQNDPRADPQIVLAVVETIGQSRREVLGLHGTNRKLPGHFKINTAARRHREIIFWSRFANPIGCANASEEDLSERRNLALPEIHSGSEKVGKCSSDQCTIYGIGRPIPRQISHRTEPIIGVVFELAASPVSVVGRRGRYSGEIGVDIEAHAVVPTIQFEL